MLLGTRGTNARSPAHRCVYGTLDTRDSRQREHRQESPVVRFIEGRTLASEVFVTPAPEEWIDQNPFQKHSSWPLCSPFSLDSATTDNAWVKFIDVINRNYAFSSTQWWAVLIPPQTGDFGAFCMLYQARPCLHIVRSFEHQPRLFLGTTQSWSLWIIEIGLGR